MAGRKRALESLEIGTFWRGKNVLLTGHTGFKGSWLAEILLQRGANVVGCALAADRKDDLFNICRLEQRLNHNIVDVRDQTQLLRIFKRTMPDVVFHLAARPLVLSSYEDPVLTWDTNVTGSLNVLECLRTVDHRCAVVMVTTDKVYELDASKVSKSEIDHLGGHDPYSSSKAAMEIAVSSWRRSFFSQSKVRIATARAGNVIGGGDWSSHRIIPDLVVALQHKNELELRDPDAVRPWQHVLDPLFGYLKLAEVLYTEDKNIFQTSFNFGPSNRSAATVIDLVNSFGEAWGEEVKRSVKNSTQHEAPFLSLNSSKAQILLGWEARWDFSKTVHHTAYWYKNYLRGGDAASLLREQIDAYTAEV